MENSFLSDYDPRWPTQFQGFADRIIGILGSELSACFHIGSTAVPGLCAKPIIDILPTVQNISIVDELRPAFEKAGFEWRGEFGITGRRYLKLSGQSAEDLDLCHIHFFQSDSFEVNKHLLFRDCLRGNSTKRDEYSALKNKLTSEFPGSRELYQKGKQDFITKLSSEAQASGSRFREPLQINLYVFTRVNGVCKFLMLKRSKQRGGFWQGITGAPEVNETLEAAAVRELFEETRIVVAKVFPLAMSYSFPLDRSIWTVEIRPEILNVDERVYWCELDSEQIPTLSDEHDAFAWETFETSSSLLKWPNNQKALAYLYSKVLQR